jgi:hypothetical protein
MKNSESIFEEELEQEVQKSRVQENDVQFHSWEELLNGLSTEYTTSFRDVCKLLKSSRVWVNKYIRPFVKSTYIRSNKRGDNTSGVNWIRLASIQLGREDMKESIWFHTKDLETYLKKNIVSITKQTKKVPYTYFMSEEQIKAYFEERKVFEETINNPNTSIIARGAAIKLLEVCHYNFLKDDPKTKTMLKHARKITERTKPSKMPIAIEELPQDFLYRMDAIHDLKDYGDADETIYRNLFKQGEIRIEMNFADNDGQIGKKVYYVPDPDPIKDEHHLGSFCIDEAAWRKYRNR